MTERDAIRQLFCEPKTDRSLIAAAELLGWSTESLAVELSAQCLLPVQTWASRPVPWSAAATLALQQWSYEAIRARGPRRSGCASTYGFVSGE